MRARNLFNTFAMFDKSRKKTMQKGVGLQEKNLTYSDFFYFYNSSNSISLSVSGFKVTADGIFR